MKTKNKQILLTNDDGIHSPGLWAVAGVLAQIGYVTVVAPREQYSGAGRSLPTNSDGIIEIKQVEVNNQNWKVYAVGGSPAQTVLHGALEILSVKPDLVVSGINFGENMGTGITTSGTVGAALEAAGLGIPSIAVSLETAIEHHYSLSDDIDFNSASHFTSLFAKLLLDQTMPFDVDLLNINIPCDASVESAWEFTRISRIRLFESVPPERTRWSEPGRVGYRFSSCWKSAEPGTDVHALKINRTISVTPVSMDMTSRIDFTKLENMLPNS